MLIRLTLMTTAAIIGGMMYFGTNESSAPVEEVAETVLTPSEPAAGPAENETDELADPVVVAASGDKAEIFDSAGAELEQTAEPQVEVSKQGGLDVTAVLPASESVDDVLAEAVAYLSARPGRPSADSPSDPEQALQIVYVTGNRVNLRAGPSTANAVVDQMVLGTEAEVLGEAADGWLQIRAVTTGIEGYMSGDFLSPDQPG